MGLIVRRILRHAVRAGFRLVARVYTENEPFPLASAGKRRNGFEPHARDKTQGLNI